MADVASSFKNWSKTAASNNPTSSTNIGTGLAPNFQQVQATVRTELGSRNAGISSAATVDLNTVDEGTVLVNHASGTVAISSFGTVSSGIKKLITFSVAAGSLTLTYNATSMVLPTSANITVTNGDSLIAESLGSGNWKIHGYFPSNGSPVGFSALEPKGITSLSANVTLTSSNIGNLVVNLSGTIWTATMPATPSIGDTIAFSALTTRLNVTANTGQNINAFGLAAQSTIAVLKSDTVTLVWDGTSWDAMSEFKSNIGSAVQTRRDLIASRAVDTTYTNSTGRAIFLNVSATMSGASNIAFNVGGFIYRGSWAASAGTNSLFSTVILDGESYSLSSSAVSSIQAWTEVST